MKAYSSIASFLLSFCVLVTKSLTALSFQLCASIWARPSSAQTLLTTMGASSTATTADDQQKQGDVQASLLSIIRRSFPDALSLDLEDNIVQANAEGFGVLVNGVNGNSTQLFVKRVEADKYSHKPWADLRRTLLYARTEARFYSDILPLLRAKTSSSLSSSSTNTRCSRWDIAPTCHLAETTLIDLIGEEESTSAKPSETDADPTYDENDTSILQNKGGLLILDSLKGNFFQTSPLTPDQASQCLRAIAKFHATAFQDQDILSTVSETLCEYGGSYHLKNRNPRELREMEQTWENLSNELRSVKPDLFERESIQNLGKRVKNMAEAISVELSPGFGDSYATIVHGDYKAMNVFLPGNHSDGSEEVDDHPIIIDFASTGVGNGMSDVAMHITHALHPDHLINGGEEALVEVYLDALSEALPNHSYPKDVAIRHYRLATVDYFRFVLGRLWRGVTLETFEKRKDSKNSVFVNRNVDAAICFIERADKYLAAIENEGQKNSDEI